MQTRPWVILAGRELFELAVSGDLDVATDQIRADLNARSSNVSVSPSVYEFVEEFGRTFHKYKQGSMSNQIVVPRCRKLAFADTPFIRICDA